SFECAAITAFEINWNHVQFWQQPAEDRHIHQRFLGEKINRAIGGVTGERRIKEALMICGQNHRTGLDHALAMDDSETEKQLREQTAKMITEPVIEIHSATQTA